MNGLGGAYSQILVNSRSVFSPLTGLYGLEQMPTEMVERIEVVRGGASALYGSRAANGVILITTKKGTKDDGWGVSINSNTVYTEFSQLPENQYVFGSGIMKKWNFTKNLHMKII